MKHQSKSCTYCFSLLHKFHQFWQASRHHCWNVAPNHHAVFYSWLYTLTIPPLSWPPLYILMLIFTLLLEKFGTHQPFSPCFLWSQRITVHVCKFCFIWPQKSFPLDDADRRIVTLILCPSSIKISPDSWKLLLLCTVESYSILHWRPLFWNCFTICRQFFQSELADS